MANAAENLRPDYWTHRPRSEGSPEPAALVERVKANACRRCGTEFLIGSEYCHTCGLDRESTLAIRDGWGHALDFSRIREALGLNPPAMTAMVVGVMCLLAALSVGFIYTAETLADWQAIQLWRVEWILAAVAVFLLGILLKK